MQGKQFQRPYVNLSLGLKSKGDKHFALKKRHWGMFHTFQ